MSRVFLTMAMSLDGFITGPHDDAQNPAGINGMRLMDWLGGRRDRRQHSETTGRATRTARSSSTRRCQPAPSSPGDGPGTSPATGAATTTAACRSSSRPTNHRRRTRSSGSTTSPTVSRRACSRPRPRPVTAMCCCTARTPARSASRPGVLDLIEIQLRPVLLGQGRRLFDSLPPEHIELDLVRTLEAADTLHLRYEVRRP